MLSVLKTNVFCISCLRHGHFVKSCRSLHKCRVCQKPHHTLLHIDEKSSGSPVVGAKSDATASTSSSGATPVSGSAPFTAYATMGIRSDLLLMTSRVIVESPDGSKMEEVPVTAVIVSRVTSDLPLQHIPVNRKWNHLSDIQMADPDFGQPGRINLLLGVETFAEVILHGRRCGMPGSPVALETQFGQVLAGSTSSGTPVPVVTTHHATFLSGDELLSFLGSGEVWSRWLSYL